MHRSPLQHGRKAVPPPPTWPESKLIRNSMSCFSPHSCVHRGFLMRHRMLLVKSREPFRGEPSVPSLIGYHSAINGLINGESVPECTRFNYFSHKHDERWRKYFILLIATYSLYPCINFLSIQRQWSVFSKIYILCLPLHYAIFNWNL